MYGGARKYTVQSLGYTGPAGVRYLISGWNLTKSTSPTAHAIELQLVFRNSDGTISRHIVQFSAYTHTWQYAEAAYVSTKPYSRVDVYAVMGNPQGTAYFDSIRLRRI
jgi:hypothetical protein